MSRTKVALVGVGEIARRAHMPTLAESRDFELAAAVTLGPPAEGVPTFATISAMKAAIPDVTAVSICTPPRGRLALIAEAFSNGLDVMAEKPPAATPGEARVFIELAERAGRVMFLSWHSRFAAAVEPAASWLTGKTIRGVQVAWKEDVRVYHPGQAWIWEPGIGVFDPGVNALSVVTRILPGPLTVESALLRFPSNKAAPIAADLVLSHVDGWRVEAAFDFDQRDGPPTWSIDIQTDAGALKLSQGANRMVVDGRPVDVGEAPPYRLLYAHFAELLTRRESDADIAPFELVADAFMVGRRGEAPPFEDF